MADFISESVRYALTDGGTLAVLTVLLVSLALLVLDAWRDVLKGRVATPVKAHPWLAGAFLLAVALLSTRRFWALAPLVAGVALAVVLRNRRWSGVRRWIVVGTAILTLAAIEGQRRYEHRERDKRSVYVVLSFEPDGDLGTPSSDRGWRTLATTFHEAFSGVSGVDIRPQPVDAATYAQFGPATPREERHRQLRAMGADIVLDSVLRVRSVDSQAAHAILLVDLMRVEERGWLAPTGRRFRFAGSAAALSYIALRTAHEFLDTVEPDRFTSEEQQRVRLNIFTILERLIAADADSALKAQAAVIRHAGVNRDSLRELLVASAPEALAGEAAGLDRSDREAGMAKLKGAR